MFGGKNQASQSPTAFGSMLQAATYGLVIPVIYGLTQSPLLAIWAENLRQGGSTKKFKQMKKGITSYCENINFLLGKNPILGVLQMWNNGSKLPLANQKYSVAVTSGGSGAITIPDSHFLSVIGVTLTQSYSETFDDYGSQGSSTVTGSMEVPLWNQLLAGPDPVDSSDFRNFPFTYRWEPSYGAEIQIDTLPTGALPSGTLNIYYAQLTSATDNQTPASKLRLSFENILGSGDEYDGFTAQQIQYPFYAGLGSQDIDLGAAGVIPAIKAEVQGKWGLYSTGDLDFVDIIEDVVKSGITQAAIGGGTNFGPTEHGAGAYDFPGTIQKKQATGGSAGLPAMLYDMPNTAGNYLVTIAWGNAALAISDTAGNTYTPVFAGTPSFQVWYAQAVGGPNTVNVTGAGSPSAVTILEIGGPGVAGALAATVQGVLQNASADIVKYAQSFFGGDNACGVIFSEFVLDGALPSDAVIQGIYAVAIGSFAPVRCTYFLATGTDVGIDGISGLVGSGLASLNSATLGSSSTEVYSPVSLGTSLSVLEAQEIAAGLFTSGQNAEWLPPGDIMLLSAVGFAIYYTTASPPGGTPPIPPPFTVPSGQAVSWALPAAVTIEYPHNPLLPSASIAASPAVPIPGTGSGSLIYSYGSGGLGLVASAGIGNILTNVTPGYPAYLLAVPFYGAGDAPADSAVAKWDLITPANFYEKTPAYFQAFGRIIKNPGDFPFQAPGSDPTGLVLLCFQCATPPTFPNPQGDFIDAPTRELTRAQCRAGGLWGSLSMNVQKAASDWVNDLCQAADCAPVMSGFRLKLIPRSEVSAVGNGAVYNAPTASGPVANLDADNGDFIGSITATRKARTDTDSVLQMQHINRASDYQQVVTAEPDAASIALYGIRKKDPITNNAVQDVAIARSILSIMVRRRNYVENLSYSFTLNQRWAFLEAMDLVTITDRLQGIVNVPVRLTQVEEDDSLELACEAEPFLYGIHAPQALPATQPAPYNGSASAGLSAGDVNPPIIFEPVPRLYNNGPQPQIWLVISSSATNYGGAQVYVSTDLGASYNPVGDPVIGGAITGRLTADWPAAADPDTTNDLPVDLTESIGVLSSFAVVDEDNFVYPCYVAGQQLLVENNGTLVALLNNFTIQNNGTTVADSGDFGYELMSYALANLTATSKYTLKATGGNHLRRDVFSAPDGTGAGIDHPSGSRWAFLSPAGTGILKLNMDSLWVGQQLFFKIISFNEFGAAAQSLSDVPAYGYTPTGVPSTV